MRNYPKTLNTKADFEYVMDHFGPEDWMKDLKKLLASYTDWFFVKHLDSEEDGINDDTHKVLDEGEEDKHVWSQYELKINPTAKIFRLGFSVDDIEKYLERGEKTLAAKTAG